MFISRNTEELVGSAVHRQNMAGLPMAEHGREMLSLLLKPHSAAAVSLLSHSPGATPAPPLVFQKGQATPSTQCPIKLISPDL